MRTLQSDRSQRDNYVRRNILQTDQYPYALFVPTQVTSLPAILPDSGEIAFQLVGELTIRDVARQVEWDVTGQIQGDEMIAHAATSFTFDDFSLTQPRVPIVLSVEDTIRLEMDLTFLREDSLSSSTPQEGIPEAQAATEPAAAVAAQEETSPALDCNSPAALTPSMTEGPYYKAGSPERTSLIEVGVTGTRLVITGYVLTSDCQPIPNAWLDFWQADEQGDYDNTNYRLRGHQFTDQEGRYRLETIAPGLYPGRTAHIHLKVQAPDGPVLTTQLFFPDVPGNETDRIFDPALVLPVQDTPDGQVAVYNFIVDAD